MEHLPSGLILGAGVVAVLAVVLLATFGRRILRLVLIGVGIALVIVIAWLLLDGAGLPNLSGAGDALGDAADIARVVRSQREPDPQPAVQPQPSGAAGFWNGVCAGVLGLVILTLGGVAGWFWLRWKYGHREPKATIRRPTRQRSRRAETPPVVYIARDDTDDLADLGAILEGWGFD